MSCAKFAFYASRPRRFELMRFVSEITDARVRCICLVRFVEGKSWEAIARRLHYERTSPAKIMRRWLRYL